MEEEEEEDYYIMDTNPKSYSLPNWGKQIKRQSLWGNCSKQTSFKLKTLKRGDYIFCLSVSLKAATLNPILWTKCFQLCQMQHLQMAFSLSVRYVPFGITNDPLPFRYHLKFLPDKSLL